MTSGSTNHCIQTSMNSTGRHEEENVSPPVRPIMDNSSLPLTACLLAAVVRRLYAPPRIFEQEPPFDTITVIDAALRILGDDDGDIHPLHCSVREHIKGGIPRQ